MNLIQSLMAGSYDNMKQVATKYSGGDKVRYLPTRVQKEDRYKDRNEIIIIHINSSGMN